MHIIYVKLIKLWIRSIVVNLFYFLGLLYDSLEVIKKVIFIISESYWGAKGQSEGMKAISCKLIN